MPTLSARRRIGLIGIFMLVVWTLAVYRGVTVVDTLEDNRRGCVCPTAPTVSCRPSTQFDDLEKRVRFLQEEIDRLKRRPLSVAIENTPKSTPTRPIDVVTRQSLASRTTIDDEEVKREQQIRLWRIETTSYGWWLFVRHRLTTMTERMTQLAPEGFAGGAGAADNLKAIKAIIDDSTEHFHSIIANVDQLRNRSGLKDWAREESVAMTDFVQRRFRNWQNPGNCNHSDVKKLVCHVNKICGFGCQAHSVMYCFILALGLGRVLILRSDSWTYNRGGNGWEDIFQPLSTCTQDGSFKAIPVYKPSQYDPSVPVLRAMFIDNYIGDHPPFLPLLVPADIVGKVRRFHRQPGLWFLGQVARYLLRPNEAMKTLINNTKESLQFRKPIVGIHIRRTDKVLLEARAHQVEEYMKAVEEYYLQMGMEFAQQKRVFVATDEATVVRELKSKYPDYVFVFNEDASVKAKRHRYTVDSLKGVIADIVLLSDCDYLVCTFSSQVCRVSYELMQTKHSDASRLYYSLDDSYYFGGQRPRWMQATHQHVPRNDKEIEVEVGDILGIDGEEEGYYIGRNKRTRKRGRYPMFKVEELIDIAEFPSLRGG